MSCAFFPHLFVRRCCWRVITRDIPHSTAATFQDSGTAKPAAEWTPPSIFDVSDKCAYLTLSGQATSSYSTVSKTYDASKSNDTKRASNAATHWLLEVRACGVSKGNQERRSTLGSENFRLACRATWRTHLAFLWVERTGYDKPTMDGVCENLLLGCVQCWRSVEAW
jgi:hypothetical protein